MRAPITFLVCLLLGPSLAHGEPQGDHASKPDREVQMLGYNVGTWEGHGETKGGPFGPAGKLSSKQTCGWFSGGFQVVCRGEETGPTGKRGFLNILAYDEKQKAYTQYGISSLGDIEYDRGGSLVGNKLTYIIEQDEGGTHLKVRYTELRLSQSLYTYEAEASLGGRPWKVIAQGEITKVK